MTAARTLAAWALGPGPAAAPEQARRAACRHLLDGLGTAIAAGRAGIAAPAVTVARGLGGPPEATLPGTGARGSAVAAALATGTLVHALDFDDTHAGGLVHATAVVLPAALAVGEQTGASGAEVLAAAVAGYETVCRIAAAAPHAFHARGLHATMSCGVMAAAIVAARLMRLDADQAVNALGVAGSQAGGLLEFLTTGASTKQLHPGLASASGILAARLAAAGASGPDTVLEGPHGLYKALAGREVDAAAVTEGLGERWETTRITVKPYPACQLMHVTLDAVAQAVRGRDVRASEVAEVVADVHPDSAAIVCEPAERKIRPRTPYDAKFSLPWSVAALLIDGEVTLATYAPESIARPEVAELAARVRTVITPSGDVAADAPGHVRVRLAGGRVLEGRVPRSVGGPGRPLGDAELDAKFTANAAGAPEAAEAAELARRVRGLAAEPGLSTIAALADRLARPAPEEPT
ncbi:MmgE/Prp family protein [Sphaerisporangium siamense]|uniref:2-methylcitrate dehydratase PrpD n=1 Tax=Sphaerisporangium siamense TaxID=795645 RepID=A0A7W7GEY1_9ACTN|nr:MmgE/PrpD family protein [Sphaerisporangium siamense]MBB4704516.1 2-methylcitrate dehydratase PrpD [Sphaerisporangium siamense]GII86128.1 MmgE/Prp family protein [Sphaerisporangium siamense]